MVVSGNFTEIVHLTLSFDSMTVVKIIEHKQLLLCKTEHQIPGPENTLALAFGSNQSRARDDYSSGIIKAPWCVKRLCAAVLGFLMV